MLHTMQEWTAFLKSPEGCCTLDNVYGADDTQSQRYIRAAQNFQEQNAVESFAFFSAPGRTELCGNHTDHQHGHVLAAAVTMDILAVAAPRQDGCVRIHSEGFGTLELDGRDEAIHEAERNTSAALVRGVLAGMRREGFHAGGFSAYVTSRVPEGSGLSSSAAFEVLIGTILNHLYNQNHCATPEQIARIGQYAENTYFGKPSGLMDQMASSVGGAVHINFGSPENPTIERLHVRFEDDVFCIVNAGGSHADMTPDYAAIPTEMRAVAACMGQMVLGDCSAEEFFSLLPALRGNVSDRALLRAMHFFEETARVPMQATALREGNIALYRKHMLQSGQSSCTRLQNTYPSGNTQERSVSLALSIAEQVLQEKGAWRVHGGGFAGTIQALIPKDMLHAFMERMQQCFGQGCCYPLEVRPVGGWALPIIYS